MTRRSFARFYVDVSIAADEHSHRVLLDGKPVRTPGRVGLALPTAALAGAIGEEWRVQGKQIDPAGMPLTALAYAALDLLPKHRGAVIDHILGFGSSDLLCYRADAPAELAQRHARIWDPLLAWIAEAHGVVLQSGAGVTFIEQPAGAGLAFEKLIASQTDFELAAIDRAASLTGSLVLALALRDGRLSGLEAFSAALVDEDFQAEKWGRDGEAEARRRVILAELLAAERFLRFLGAPQT
jgi:chaperone required for assembly of F1-ATPase